MKSLLRPIVGMVASLPFMPSTLRDLLMWPIATRIFGKGYSYPVRLKEGFSMYGSMEDILSRRILFQGSFVKELWEPETSNKLEELAEKSHHILIAGAHMGYMVLKAAHHTQGHVHAFEPIPELFAMCQKNIDLNPLLKDRITLTQAALGQESGILKMYVEDIRSSAIAYSGGHIKHNHIVEVPVVTIDEYAKKYSVIFDLVLLDIEGFEWFALQGAAETLKSKPALIIEVSPKILAHTSVTSEMIFNKLHEMGYTTEVLDQEKDYANIYAHI